MNATMHHRCRGAVAILVLLLPWAPGLQARARAQTPPPAQPSPVVRPEAKVHLDRGLELYRGKAFDAAVSEFEKAYTLDPHRDVLYVWAQALRLGGRCVEALPMYEKFLASRPPIAEADLARKNAARCSTASPAAPPEPSPPPAAPPPPPVDLAPAAPAASANIALAAPPAERPPARPSITRRVLFGAGAVSLAAGGALFLSARSERDQARSAATYGEFQQHLGASVTRERFAVGAAVVGLTLLTATVVHYLVRSDF